LELETLNLKLCEDIDCHLARFSRISTDPPAVVNALTSRSDISQPAAAAGSYADA